MPLTSDWIALHYRGKSGITHVESKQVGDKMVELLGAEYIGEIETTIGKFYKYKVENLEKAYKIQRNLAMLCG
jgi:hypothetical protein